MKNTTDINITVPNSSGEIWLEYGWIKGDNDYQDMLWYNEGRAEEFNTWFRALMTKIRVNEPSGTMYFIAGIHKQPHGSGRADVRIICTEAAMQGEG